MTCSSIYADIVAVWYLTTGAPYAIFRQLRHWVIEIGGHCPVAGPLHHDVTSEWCVTMAGVEAAVNSCDPEGPAGFDCS